MTDWFRTWHGAPTDPKWRLVAKRAGVRPGDVWAVVSYLFDRASQAEDRGSVVGHDPELIAEVFGYEADDVSRIIVELEAKSVIADGRLTAWDKYQPKREDGSAERGKAYRERIRTNTERTQTQPNATERPEERRLETEQTPSSLRSDGERARRGTNPIVILSSIVDGPSAQRWVTHLEDKGKKPSAAQVEELCGVLNQVKAAGGSPAEALRFAIKKGWVSLELEYLRNNGFPLKTAAPTATEAWPPEKWQRVVDNFRQRGDWNREGLGPPPGEPGCRVPAELLDRAA